jgi:hypothetical protein
MLGRYDVKVLVRGPTAFEIAGKGDIEIGVYVNDYDWNKVLDRLKKKYGDPYNIDGDYAKFY